LCARQRLVRVVDEGEKKKEKKRTVSLT